MIKDEVCKVCLFRPSRMRRDFIKPGKKLKLKLPTSLTSVCVSWEPGLLFDTIFLASGINSKPHAHPMQ